MENSATERIEDITRKLYAHQDGSYEISFRYAYT